MPATGKRRTKSGSQDAHLKGYASLYRKETETVMPGYYSVKLDRYNINAELTATERAAIHRYTFPETEEARIIIDLTEGNDNTIRTYLKQVNDSTFKGFRYSNGWAVDQREYFAVVLSKPIENFILYNNNKRKRRKKELEAQKVKGFLEFSTSGNEQVLLKMGISPVSMENALTNLQKEIPHWNFDKISKDANNKWNNELSKIQIKTEKKSKKKIFYTALFHSMMAPTLYNDHNGDYRGTDKKIYRNPGFNNYTLFSLWDTYRAAHPLYTLIQPERVPDMINSMLAIYQQQGKLPVWHLRGNETNCMPGYSSVPVVADAVLKGFKSINKDLAYEAIKSTATGHFEPGVKELMERGYIPADYMVESVASAMEYAISDWAISKLAEESGKMQDAAYFFDRSKAFKYYFDPHTRFMRGRLSDGSWRTPFNPIDAPHGTGDFCEGNAWQYLWMVPHNPEALIKMLGGENEFSDKLDSLFIIDSEQGEKASPDISGLIGQYAHGNEPSHHTTYLYAYAGKQHKTAEKVRYIMDNFYTDQPDGICGNEDCGQMSAWYIFSAMGFYPVNPASGMYVFGSPNLDEITINLPKNKQFTILAVNNNAQNKYIQNVTLNGQPYLRSYITHKKILKGGILKFFMGPEPNKSFGQAPNNRPRSILY
jgi:predicted alpha-1,2-mannosidase